jgi:hypothetical protein
MDKKYFQIIIIATIFILIISVFYSLYKNENIILGISFFEDRNADILSEDEKESLNLYHLGVYKAISRDGNGKVMEYKLIKLKKEEPIAIEIMTDIEKQEIGLSPDIKIQVLQRSQKGEVLVYRLIKNESDILTKY